jgi:Lrp/AsnC family transcriptional regulator for asnA, asnC and gidA
MENISYLSAVTGEYNIMLEYVCQNNEDLLEFTKWLKRKPEVNRLNTRVILKIFKAQYPIRVQNPR